VYNKTCMLPDAYICIYGLLFVPDNSDWNWAGLAELVQFSSIRYNANPCSSS